MTASQLVVFDCDGVLVDTERLTVGVEARVLTELGWPMTADEVVSRWMGRTSAFVGRTVRPDQPPTVNLEKLFLATLSRRPTAAECRRLTEYVEANGENPSGAYGDVLWALLNCSEFSLNH